MERNACIIDAGLEDSFSSFWEASLVVLKLRCERECREG